MWHVDKQEEHTSQRNEVQKAAMPIRNSNIEAKIENDIQDINNVLKAAISQIGAYRKNLQGGAK